MFAFVTSAVRVRVRGASLNVHLRGDGAPVLLVHGFPLDHAQWEQQLESLSGWRLIAPDLRGAGTSDAPADPPYSMARYADDLIAVLDAVEAEHAVCCGFSMGGYVLFELWRRHSRRIRALILCDTRAEPDTPEGREGRDALAEVAERDGMDAVADRLLPKLVGETTRATKPALVDRIRHIILRAPVAGVVGALHAMRDRADSQDLLERITVPTLVVCGAEDALTPPATMRAMAERLRGSRYEEIAEAGHLSPLEQPDRVNRAMRAFLQTV